MEKKDDFLQISRSFSETLEKKVDELCKDEKYASHSIEILNASLEIFSGINKLNTIIYKSEFVKN